MFENITNQYSEIELNAMMLSTIHAMLEANFSRSKKPVVGELSQEYSIPAIRGNESGLTREELIKNILDVSERTLKQASPGAVVIRTSTGYIYEDSHGRHQDQLDDNLQWQFCKCKYHQ